MLKKALGIVIICLTVLLLDSSTFSIAKADAAELCGGVFSEIPGYSRALEIALSKTLKKNRTKGLSERDLHLIVESVFKKAEGRKHKIPDYWKKTAEERTLQILTREVGEVLAHQGLVKYYKDHNYLKKSSRIYTKFSVINRSRTFNGLSLILLASSLTRGHLPMLLPEGKFNIKTQDMNTLLLEGLSSPAGKEIVARYKLRLEANRGFDVFNRYYVRIAVVIYAYLFYDRAQDFIDERRQSEDENAFDILFEGLQDVLGEKIGIDSLRSS